MNALRRYTLLSVFMTIFLDLVGFGMFIPVLANLARDLDATSAQAAALSTYFSAGTLLAVLFLGRLSDTFGRRALLIATIAVSCVMQLLTGFVGSYLALAAVRFVAGMASGNIAVAQASIADVSPPSVRARNMVVVGLAFGGGFAVGPALGAGITRIFEDDYLMALGVTAAALNMINLLFVAWRLPETHPRLARPEVASLRLEDGGTQPQSRPDGHASGAPKHEPVAIHMHSPLNLRHDLADVWHNKALRVVLMLQFLQIFGFVGLETILPIVLRDAYGLNNARIYDLFLVIGVSVLFFNGYLARKALKKVGEVRTLNAGQVLLTLGIAGVAACVPNVTALQAALIVMAGGTGLANPALSGLVSRLSPPEKQGSAFGVAQTLGSLARIVGPVLMGYLYDTFHGATSLYFSVGLLAVGALLGIATLQRLAAPHLVVRPPIL